MAVNIERIDPTLVVLEEDNKWYPDIHGEGTETDDLGGQDGPNNVAVKQLIGRVNYNREELNDIGDVGKQFIIDETGAPISFLNDDVKKCNNHFDGEYLDSGRLKLENHISSGLAPVDPIDPTKTQWFAVASLNHVPVDNAICKINGIFYFNEKGFYETPLAYESNVTRTVIEFVIFRAYVQEEAEFKIIRGAINPYKNVHEYVSDKIRQIEFKGKNDSDTIFAKKFMSRWNGAPKDYYIKTVFSPPNPWQTSLYWQPAILYARFVNTSASHTTTCAPPRECRNEDHPDYIRGAMPLQNISEFRSSSFIHSSISGEYKYRKVMKVVNHG